MSQAAEGSLDWPDGQERTPPGERESYPHGFKVSRSKAFDSIKRELERMNAAEIDVDTAALHTQQAPHRPYKDRTPDDPGVVARFKKDGKQYVYPMDRWDNLRDNARAIALTLEAKRSLIRYGVETLESEFQAHALPPGDGSSAEAVEPAGPEPKPAHEVLGVDPDANERLIKVAFEEQIKEKHSDQGGTDKETVQVKKARDAMMDGQPKKEV